MTTGTQVVVQQESTMALSDEQRKAQKIEQFSRFSSLNPQWSREFVFFFFFINEVYIFNFRLKKIVFLNTQIGILMLRSVIS